MAERFSNPVIQYLDTKGDPLGAGKLYFYESGTSTPLDTYSDEALTTPNTNPVVLDGDGRTGSIFLQNAQYKVKLDTAADVNVWERDPVASAGDVIGDIDTYAELKALNVTLLTEGQVIPVAGRTAWGDGGVGEFRATQSNPGADNDGTILHSDTAGWYFVRQDITWLLSKWFGVKADDSTDDTTALQNCINASAATSAVNYGTIFPSGTCRVTALTFKNASSSTDYVFKSLGGMELKGTSSTGHVVTVAADRVHLEDIDVTAHTTRTTSGSGITVSGDNCSLTRCNATGQPGVGISIGGSGSTIDNCSGIQNAGAFEMLVAGSGHTVISPVCTRVAGTGLGTALALTGDQITVIGGTYSNSNKGITVAGAGCNIFSPNFVGDGTVAMLRGLDIEATATNTTAIGLEASYTNVTNAVVVDASSTGTVITQDGDTIHYGALRAATGLQADEGVEFGSGGPTITTGTGTPEGVETAPVGSLFMRTNGTQGTIIYSKITGAGNTGWQVLNSWIKHSTVHTSISSGTSIEWTAIPSDVTNIKIAFATHSPAASQDLIMQLGDASSYETSGYNGTVHDGASGTNWSTSALITKGVTAGDDVNGTIWLTQTTGNEWGIDSGTQEEGGSMAQAKGNKTLTGALTRIQLLMSAGTTFDGGGNYALYYQ